MADKQWFWNSTSRTAGVAVAATALSALVGYREADGVDPEDLMPKLGPVPMEAIIGLAAGGLALSGVAGTGKFGSGLAGAADGCVAVFSVSGGQSLGHKLHEVFKGTGGLLPGTGAKRERAQLAENPKKEILDAHGRHMEVRVRQESPNQDL